MTKLLETAFTRFPLVYHTQFTSLQDASFGLEKARMRSGPSVGSFPSVVFETVSVLVKLTTTPFRLFEKDRRSSFCL